MIRFAEAVLPGHPDKFCDQVADAIVAEALRVDPQAFAQVEVGVWSDQVWLSGNIVTRQAFSRDPADIVVETALSLGLDGSNWIDAHRYKVTDTLCRNIDDPTEGRTICDDQSIVIGYAGYDEKTRFLPPEQFLVHAFREDLWDACRGGRLDGFGPDGKVLITLREEGRSWHLERVLVTLQHREGDSLLEVTSRVLATLAESYLKVQLADSRWVVAWSLVAVSINSNGPYFRAGSDGDNGQTGRKLVMDYYGPRIPIGGGALSGKHPGHIDRLAAYVARKSAISTVFSGARECLIQLVYSPNQDEPLEVVWSVEGGGTRQSRKVFGFNEMLGSADSYRISVELGQGRHFWDQDLPWNRQK